MEIFIPREKLFLRGGIFCVTKYRINDNGEVETTPYEDPLYVENAVMNTGGALALDLIIGAGGTAFNNANSYLGVGDSTTANSAAFTDLQAATNKLRKAMNATYPSRASQVVTFKATFGSSDANYAWQEYGVFNASTGGTMLCRAVSSLGTKASGTSWDLTYTLQLP